MATGKCGRSDWNWHAKANGKMTWVHGVHSTQGFFEPELELVVGLEHFLFSHILGIIILTDFHYSTIFKVPQTHTVGVLMTRACPGWCLGNRGKSQRALRIRSVKLVLVYTKSMSSCCAQAHLFKPGGSPQGCCNKVQYCPGICQSWCMNPGGWISAVRDLMYCNIL